MTSHNETRLDESAIKSQFPGEVVTKALVRDVELPGGAGTMALITLDNSLDHTKPNSHGPAGLLELNHALDAVASRPDIVAVGVTGKPFIFAVGADLKGAALISSRSQGLAVIQLGHAVYRRLGELRVPTFAFVNGVALGGGLEVALHCTYRTISSDVSAVAFPECFLGLLPGAGGTYLLPRLIGPSAALKVIVENAMSQNKMLRAREAFELGIADAMFEPADFLVQSLRWAAGILTSPPAPREPLAPAAEWEQAVAQARFFADGKVHGAAPAPYRAIDLVAAARERSRDEGFAAEDEAMADLFVSDEFKASLYAFDLTQKRARHAAGAPDGALARPVTKVGVVGAGLMAAQIALLFARRLSVPVVLTDLDQARLDSGVGYVHGEIAKLAARGRLGADEAARLTGLVSGSLSLADAFADADFVIEAVFEEMSVKKRVFADVEAVVSPDCVLATNTSSLSVTEMASRLAVPSRVVGFHFFNPVAMMPLVEVVRGGLTSDAAVATALAVGKSLKKNCVLVSDAPAFVVNRLLTRFLGAITAAVDEGTPFDVAEHAAEHAADPLGLPMPPFLLLQLVGPAVALHVAETLHAAFPSRYGVSPKLRALVEAGKTSVYLPGFSVDPAVVALLSGGSHPSTGEQVLQRALEALAEEIRIMLDDGVVAGPEDIDLCMILGAGWPFHLGGITPYLDRTGIAEKVTGARFR